MSRGWIAGLLAAVVVVAVAAGLTAWQVVTAPWPDHHGETSLAALDADVEVVRDADGMPVIHAATADDLFAAQGYVHAQDRFWQMDVSRHIATGRTAELLGDEGLAADRFLRTLGWARVAEAELAALSDHARGVLEAYADGVNAYLAQRRPGELGVAYRLLDPLGPREPDPWEPAHSLAYLKVMAWDLRTNLEAEIERAVLASAGFDGERIADLFPPYPDDGPVIVPGFDGGDLAGDQPDRAHLDHPDVAAGVRRLADRVAEVERLTGLGGVGLGSNSWVVAGEHTASGAPVLANDPHLDIGMPSVWYENHLRCDERADADACPYDVAGVSLPGVPGVIIGQTDSTAWALTNLGADVTDLYVERVHPDDDHRVAVEGEWVDVEVRTETLRSADGTTEELEVRMSRNGPIVSDVYGAVEEVAPSAMPDVHADDGAAAGSGDADPGGGDGARYALSLRWTALEPGPTFEALPQLNAASDVDEFRAAAEDFVVPAQNLLWADQSGTIAYQAPGWLPIRRAHDGAFPVPGWDDAYQWDGYLPFDELPAETNPDRGWIATANEAVVEPGAFDVPLTADWGRGHRKRRIVELLTDQLGGYDVGDAAAAQLDAFDRSGARGVPHAVAVDDRGDPRVAEMQRLLADWDQRAEADSAGAAAWMATWRQLLAVTFHPELPQAAWPRRHDRYVDVMAELYQRPDDAWWDDPATAAREDRDSILHRAMGRAHDELADELGDDPSAWRWGEVHTATFREPTVGDSGLAAVEALFNRGEWPVSGGFGIVNATGWDAVDGYEVVTIPSVRTAVDLADPDRTVRLHAPGQSGHPLHDHYTHLADAWAEGVARRRPFTAEAVEAAAIDRLLLGSPRSETGRSHGGG